MTRRYYLDTSIWLDLIESRDEPGIPKGRWAYELIQKIIEDEEFIVYSDNVLAELSMLGYTNSDVEDIFIGLSKILVYTECSENHINRANDIARSRRIPKRDVLHALIAKENDAIMVTYDRHFQVLLDIIKPFKPCDLI